MAHPHPGDCVVAFSRKALHRLRSDIAATPWSRRAAAAPTPAAAGNADHTARAAAPRAVGLVYGGLPPDARRSQAALFNAGASGAGGGYEVLVASDAVGMGLNLHIRRRARGVWCWAVLCERERLILRTHRRPIVGVTHKNVGAKHAAALCHHPPTHLLTHPPTQAPHSPAHPQPPPRVVFAAMHKFGGESHAPLRT